MELRARAYNARMDVLDSNHKLAVSLLLIKQISSQPSLQADKRDCVQPLPTPPAAAVEVRATAYNACMDVLDSDHKPVWATLAVSLPVMKHAEQRRLVSHLFKAAVAAQAPAAPALSLSASKISLGQVS